MYLKYCSAVSHHFQDK